jgi:SAM-dependent methyltransferase
MSVMEALRRSLGLQDHSAAEDAPLECESWWLDSIAQRPDGIAIAGWAFPPRDGDLAIEMFTLNGRPFSSGRIYPRPEVAKFFWQRPDAIQSGFECFEPGDAESLYPGGFATVDLAGSGSALPDGLSRQWLYPAPALRADLPDSDRQCRVTGDRNDEGFISTGATDWGRLDAALRHYAGKGFEGFGRILDWGCGCGRLGRYTARKNPAAFHGCDIDADNVEWCRAHLDGRYSASPLRPPTEYPAGYFDVIYGVSVFTHFRAPLQDAWLKELRRISKPGAYLLMTVHGMTALDFCGYPPEKRRASRKRIRAGRLVVTGSNLDLDGMVDHEGQYVNVFHHSDYVRSHWSRWFEVVDILPGYIFTHDLVVMRATNWRALLHRGA